MQRYLNKSKVLSTSPSKPPLTSNGKKHEKPQVVFGQAASKAKVLPREYAGNVLRDIKHARLELNQVRSAKERLRSLKLWDEVDDGNFNDVDEHLQAAQEALERILDELQ